MYSNGKSEFNLLQERTYIWLTYGVDNDGAQSDSSSSSSGEWSIHMLYIVIQTTRYTVESSSLDAKVSSVKRSVECTCLVFEMKLLLEL